MYFAFYNKAWNNLNWITLHKKCPYSELFWPAFCIIRTFPYSVRMRENADQHNSKYRQTLCSVIWQKLTALRQILQSLSCKLSPPTLAAFHILFKTISLFFPTTYPYFAVVPDSSCKN